MENAKHSQVDAKSSEVHSQMNYIKTVNGFIHEDRLLLLGILMTRKKKLIMAI